MFKNVWFFSLPMVGSFFLDGTRMKRVCFRKALMVTDFFKTHRHIDFLVRVYFELDCVERVAQRRCTWMGTRMKRVCLRKTLMGDGFCLNAKCAKFFRKVRKGVVLGWGWG